MICRTEEAGWLTGERAAGQRVPARARMQHGKAGCGAPRGFGACAWAHAPTPQLPTLPADDEDFRGDLGPSGLPLLTEHDVACIRELGCGPWPPNAWGADQRQRECGCRQGPVTPAAAAANWLAAAASCRVAGPPSRPTHPHSTPAAPASRSASSPSPPAGHQLSPLLPRLNPPCSARFEVDFLSLSFCNCVEDVCAARGLLDSLGMQQTKVLAKVGGEGSARWPCRPAHRGGSAHSGLWCAAGQGPGQGVRERAVHGSPATAQPCGRLRRGAAGHGGPTCTAPRPLVPLTIPRLPSYHPAPLTRHQIERKAAIRSFEGIAHTADGIIVSRGNLGLDFEPEVGEGRVAACWACGSLVASAVAGLEPEGGKGGGVRDA